MKLRQIVRRWLGVPELEDRVERWDRLMVDQVGIIADIHARFPSQSVVIVCSPVGQGLVKVLPAHFDHYNDALNLCRFIQEEYRCPPENTWADVPYMRMNHSRDLIQRRRE